MSKKKAKEKSYFVMSWWVTAFGLSLAFGLGYYFFGSVEGGIRAVFLAAVLSILEVSLSFDNAVVNAVVLKDMTPIWRQRFLTWGMLIAVFGMRLVFPLVIVSVMAKMNPWQALLLAANQPEDYARIMLESKILLAAFGGSFLMMVALKYFFDESKEVHWVAVLEKYLVKIGKVEAVPLGICLLLLYGISRFLSDGDALSFLIAGIFGLLTYITVDGISTFLQIPEAGVKNIEKAGFGMFMYLQILDSSFSFDGVIGAFAITNNLFIMAIGLGIGAMFVRSLTIFLVEKSTLAEFRFLEHGAFYAIAALAVVMFTDTFIHVPEVISGLVGAILVGLSFWSSVRHNRRVAKAR